MSEQVEVNIKQRIIGALVLVSLGIIFIPLLLNGGFYRNSSKMQHKIQPMPAELNKKLPSIPHALTMPEAVPLASVPVQFSADLETELASKSESNSDKVSTKNTVNEGLDEQETIVAISKSSEKHILVKSDKKQTVSIKSSRKITPTVLNKAYHRADKPKSKKIDKSYALQVASFGKKTNAINLQNKLRKKHFKAYVEAINTTKGYRYRVRVGPYLRFDQLAKIKKSIEKGFKMKNMVIILYKK